MKLILDPKVFVAFESEGDEDTERAVVHTEGAIIEALQTVPGYDYSGLHHGPPRNEDE